MKRIISFLLAVSILPLCGCSTQKQPQPDEPAKPLDLTTKSQEFIRLGNNFSFAFLDRVQAEAKTDYVISPLSLQILLGMILDGAQGETEAQICKVLGYGAGETEAVNLFCKSMLQQLPAMDPKTTLKMANAIFVDEGWPLKKSYMDDVKQYYSAEIANLPFSDNQTSLARINGWCSDHTNQLIPKILDSVDPNMLAYLLNALYFKSQWAHQFPKAATGKEVFTDESGGQGGAQMMRLNESFAYTETKVFQAVKLPYGNGAFSMTVLLPKKGSKVSDVTAALTKTDWNELRADMVSCTVDLWLPKFETTFHIHLNELLSAMGMPAAFDAEKAEFKGMSEYALYLSFVQQDAVIKVDEEGAEAAAISSAGMMKETAFIPDDQVVFHADHPFIYLITENSSGAVLFAGRFSKP